MKKWIKLTSTALIASTLLVACQAQPSEEAKRVDPLSQEESQAESQGQETKSDATSNSEGADQSSHKESAKADQDNQDDQDDQDDQAASSRRSSSSRSRSDRRGAKVDVAAISKDLEEAVANFEDQFPGAELTSIEVESEGQTRFEIEGEDDEKEYSLSLGEDLAMVEKKEELGSANNPEDGFQLDQVISLEEATEIALKEADAKTAKQWELERDSDGKLYWKVELRDGRQNKGEVKIDAESGEVVAYD
ncbi:MULTISPECIES: PepSY domain-containing protein [Aerococcus]|uniref:PepSY domain-containing protein n=1 Tax=Aerococcus sanguinicola TaxID=119206 RepID=A0A5N1GLT2_9LACT|nr:MULTISPECIES: PepSY domain-containing protein [Aerococcus]KAA9301276.1 PepSY domain-containing protein [Aerococcus sanguinicola]MDK6369187.1 PepSY domain-containing protein [Aerococcus sp. UMB9870]MDK6679011.1 PepSY domain-containing protein [Aerococcus sp. UMB8608]MDK6687440.1 PepSY domain-containing protein [Aerococcus sp. UMB8623]MDK6940073.1 PepSY domain-containing protein [Aerococcus sp. UMB8487]